MQIRECSQNIYRERDAVKIDGFIYEQDYRTVVEIWQSTVIIRRDLDE